MKGLEIIYKGQRTCISTEFMSTIFIYQNYGDYFIEVGGTDFSNGKSGIAHKWIDSKLGFGDKIIINIIEKDSCESTQPKEISAPLTENTDEFNMRLIAQFRVLEQLLKNQGLI